MTVMRVLLMVGVALCFALPAGAQSTACPVIVANALNQIDVLCAQVGRNQACYGNLTLEAEAQPGVSGLKFDEPGDIADVMAIRTLRLSPLLEPDEWGVALMKLQANLPDTLPGQSVTVLLFGDVAVEAAIQLTEKAVRVRAESRVNVRGGPSTADRVVGSLGPGERATAVGRSASGEWLRVVLPDGTIGWVAGFLVAVDGDAGELREMAGADRVYRAMQAFYFRSGVGDAPCAEAPDSGILIQTPEGAGTVELRVNEVNIALGSTIFLQAVPDDALYVHVIEGQATLTAFGESEMVAAGNKAAVPLDENLRAAGPPTTPEPYAAADVAGLPLDALPEAATAGEPASIEAADDVTICTLTARDAVNLRDGPGTVYPRAGALEGTANPVGQAVGADGYTWWLLADGRWVRSDVVEVVGPCAALPTVTDIPPVPTAAPVVNTSSGGGGGGGRKIYDLHPCAQTSGLPIKAGDRVFLAFGSGGYPTIPEAEAALAGHTLTIMVDGVPYSIEYHGIRDHGGKGAYANSGNAWWTATPGTHTIYAAWTVDPGWTNTCVITIGE